MNNNDNVVSFNELEKDLKKAKRKAALREGYQKAKTEIVKTVKWCEENPTTVASITAVAMGSTKLLNTIAKRIDKQKSERTYYDRSLQQNISLKRNLTKAEKTYARERHDNTGETYYEIYRSMNILK